MLYFSEHLQEMHQNDPKWGFLIIQAYCNKNMVCVHTFIVRSKLKFLFVYENVWMRQGEVIFQNVMGLLFRSMFVKIIYILAAIC